jgi:hypothetical protein
MQERYATPEPYVSAEVAAQFLGINRRLLLAMARMGIAGAYAIGTGEVRRHWIFRLSELGIAIDHRNPRPFPANDNGQGYDRRRGGSR